MAELLTYLRENLTAAIVVAIFGFGLLSAVGRTYGVAVWYFVTLLAAVGLA